MRDVYKGESDGRDYWRLTRRIFPNSCFNICIKTGCVKDHPLVRSINKIPPASEQLKLAKFDIKMLLAISVTRVGDTRGGNWGCHPSIFFLKNLASFFCSSLSLSLSLSIAFSRVSPPRGCHHHTFFLPVRPRFSTILCKFATNFSFGCHPLKGVTRGGSPPPAPPSDATDF